MDYSEQEQFLHDAEQNIAAHVAKHDAHAVGAALGIRAAAQKIAEHKRAALKVEAEQKFAEAGLPKRPIELDALQFHRGHTTSRFRINGRQATYGEFRAFLSQRGLDAAEFEMRLTASGKPERFTSRSTVTVSDASSQ